MIDYEIHILYDALNRVTWKDIEGTDAKYIYAERQLYMIKFSNGTFAFARGKSPKAAYNNFIVANK